MLAPERDQSATSDAIKEIEIFLQRFPNSKLMPEARKMEREAKDRLSEASYRVGFFYYRDRWYPGAIDRFQEVLKTDPAYTQPRRGLLPPGRIALSQRQAEPNDKAEALPYYERLLKEFEKSEYLAAAQKRVAELKTSGDTPQHPIRQQTCSQGRIPAGK